MNILIFTKNWIGDVIFEEPAIRVIKQNYPSARVVAVTTPRCVEVLKVNPYLDDVITFDGKGQDKGLWSHLKFMARLRKMKIDQVYLFHRSSTRARLAYFGGARQRFGYRTKGRDMWLTRAIDEPNSPIHDVHYFLNLLERLGLRVTSDYAYQFYFLREDLERVEHLLDRYDLDAHRLIAINPGANWPHKRWPASHFSELIRHLVSRYDVQVVITGNDEDVLVAQEILNCTKGLPVISLCAQTTVRELGALFSKCRLLISNDSGPLHIGAGVGTNVIGIFGPTAPQETAPLGRGKNLLVHYAPEGIQLPWMGKEFPAPWMELIAPEKVLQVIEKEELLVKSGALRA